MLKYRSIKALEHCIFDKTNESLNKFGNSNLSNGKTCFFLIFVQVKN